VDLSFVNIKLIIKKVGVINATIVENTLLSSVKTLNYLFTQKKDLE